MLFKNYKNKILVFYLLYIYYSYSIVLLTYEPKIIEIGKSLTFTCTFVNQKKISNSPTMWMKNRKTITFNGKKRNKTSQCSSEIIKNKMILYFTNITEKDLIYTYACMNGFNENSITIPITLSTLINMPKKENISIIYNNDKNKNFISLKFDKIYPPPKCFIKIDNYIFNFIGEYYNKINQFGYKIALKISFDINEQKYCDKNITIICTLIDKQFTINTKELTKCVFDFTLIIIFGSIFVIIVTLFIIIIILCKKKIRRKRRKKQRKLKEEIFLKNEFIIS